MSFEFPEQEPRPPEPLMFTRFKDLFIAIYDFHDQPGKLALLQDDAPTAPAELRLVELDTAPTTEKELLLSVDIKNMVVKPFGYQGLPFRLQLENNLYNGPKMITEFQNRVKDHSFVARHAWLSASVSGSVKDAPPNTPAALKLTTKVQYDSVVGSKPVFQVWTLETIPDSDTPYTVSFSGRRCTLGYSTITQGFIGEYLRISNGHLARERRLRGVSGS